MAEAQGFPTKACGRSRKVRQVEGEAKAWGKEIRWGITWGGSLRLWGAGAGTLEVQHLSFVSPLGQAIRVA